MSLSLGARSFVSLVFLTALFIYQAGKLEGQAAMQTHARNQKTPSPAQSSVGRMPTEIMTQRIYIWALGMPYLRRAKGCQVKFPKTLKEDPFVREIRHHLKFDASVLLSFSGVYNHPGNTDLYISET